MDMTHLYTVTDETEICQQLNIPAMIGIPTYSAEIMPIAHKYRWPVPTRTMAKGTIASGPSTHSTAIWASGVGINLAIVLCRKGTP
jgi:hypothetical protein